MQNNKINMQRNRNSTISVVQLLFPFPFCHAFSVLYNESPILQIHFLYLSIGVKQITLEAVIISDFNGQFFTIN